MPAATDRTIYPSTRMDQEWYPYSAFSTRPQISWPGGARVALWVSVALECMDALHPDDYPNVITPLLGQPNVRNASELDYGNRVGFWRVTDALDQYGINGTAAIGSLVANRYPDIVAESLKRGWEVMAHGTSGNRIVTGKTPNEAERALIAESRDTITAATGASPRGWLSTAVSESTMTPALLAEAGFRYTADWCNDDQPYRMIVPHGSLLTIPYSLAVNDVEVILDQRHTAWEFEQAGKDHFDSLYEEARACETGLVMCIALHPFCIGQPFRIKYLEQMLAHIMGFAGVWPATAGEIIACFESQVPG